MAGEHKPVSGSSNRAAIIARQMIGAGIIGVKAISKTRIRYGEDILIRVIGRRQPGMTYHQMLRQLEATGARPMLVQASLPDPDDALVIMWLKDYSEREAEWFV